MKKFNFLLKGLFILSLSIGLFTACDDDEPEANMPYVGNWESAIYPNINLATGTAEGTQKMVFEFTNTTFVGTIYAGLDGATTDAELQEQTSMKGSILSTATTMDAEVNEISVQGGAYTDKSTDPDVFATKFAASIGTLLEEEFTVNYVIDGDKMTFTLPVKVPGGGTFPNSINLTKVN